MKDSDFQKRAFILSSFVRLKIPLKSNVYSFCDQLIRSDWEPPLDCLNTVDEDIKSRYEEFLRNR